MSLNNKYYNNLKRLFNSTNLSYYWLGYLLADGCVDKSLLTRFQFKLAKKDLFQLQRFKKYISFKGPITIEKYIKDGKVFKAGRICITDKWVLNFAKYGIIPLKTYNPTNIVFPNKTLFLSFIVGLIDGDGCVSQRTKLNKYDIIVVMHKNWTKILQQWLNDLLSLSRDKTIRKIRVNKNIAILKISNHHIIQLLCKHIKRFNLPVLKRKWNKLKINKKFYGC